MDEATGAFRAVSRTDEEEANRRPRRFARAVFTLAGVWGVLIMTPLYFAFDAIGRTYPPPITHPDFYYGFIDVTLAWQIAFLIIATDPVRYRLIMVAAMLEKGLYIASMLTLATLDFSLRASRATNVKA
jgi:hypothetical protein